MLVFVTCFECGPVPPACITKDSLDSQPSSEAQCPVLQWLCWLSRLWRRMTSVKTVTLSSQSWISRDLNFFFIQSCFCELPISYLRLQEEGGPRVDRCQRFFRENIWTVLSACVIPEMPYLWSLWVWSHWSLDVQQVERLEIFSAIFWFIANEIV